MHLLWRCEDIQNYEGRGLSLLLLLLRCLHRYQLVPLLLRPRRSMMRDDEGDARRRYIADVQRVSDGCSGDGGVLHDSERRGYDLDGHLEQLLGRIWRDDGREGGRLLLNRQD